MIKKSLRIAFLFLLVFGILFTSMPIADAKTLGDLKKELEVLEQKALATEAKIEAAKQEMANLSFNIEKLEHQIDQAIIDMKVTQDNINYNEGQIRDRDAQIKQAMQYYQSTEGNTQYLEFIFGAKSFTDLIRRISAVQSITSRNKKLIDEMQELVAKLNAEKARLAQLKTDMEANQKKLEENWAIVNAQKAELSDLHVGELASVKQQQSLVKMYEDLGCKINEDIDACASGLIPAGTEFVRPMVKAYITSEWGWRNNPFGSGSVFHSGIDMAGVPTGSDVYATATGLVADVFWNNSGGNQVVIHHNIGGVNYSSLYAHLSSTSVKKGQTVTPNTIIGKMGNTGNSTGPHLHFTILKGLFLKDYGWSSYTSKTINPRDKVNFPSSRYVYFTNRTTKYN